MDNEFYWKTLKQTDDINNAYKTSGHTVQQEASMIKIIAMAELIRSGVKFSYISNAAGEVSEAKKNNIFSSEKQDKVQEKENTIEIKSNANIVYSCTESEMKKIMQKDYDKVILHKEDKETPKETKSIMVPDFDEGIEPEHTDDTQEAKENEEKNADANLTDQDPVNESHVPEFYEDPDLPKDPDQQKLLSSFLFDEHDVVITNDGMKAEIKFFIYPLRKYDNAACTDIFVSAISNNIMRAGVSGGKTFAVTIEFNKDVSFIIRGKWENGVFSSSVISLNQELGSNAIDDVKHYVPSTPTSTLYVKQKFDDMECYIFPASSGDNSATGYALAAIAYVDDSSAVNIITPSEDGTFIIHDNYAIDAYWQGNNLTLYYEFEEI
jgi:hypothetical protein